MADGVDVDIEFHPGFLTARVTPPAVKQFVKRSAESVADDMVVDMQRAVPVDTWDLHNTIGAEVDADGEIELAAGGNGVKYAAAVEFGRPDDMPNYPMQPYIRPAATKYRGELGR